MPVRYILLSVWVRLSILSQLSIIQCMRLCVLSLTNPLVMISRIYTLSYYHNQMGSTKYYPVFRVRLWNNGMRWMSLYILMWWKLVRPNATAAWCRCIFQHEYVWSVKTNKWGPCHGNKYQYWLSLNINLLLETYLQNKTVPLHMHLLTLIWQRIKDIYLNTLLISLATTE